MIDPGLMDMIMALRRSSVSDTDVLRAMESVPRRHFVPDMLWEKAYDDRSLPIACGQSISAPLTVARLTQLLDLKPDMKLLEIGTGSGYHAAVLSKMVTRVYSIERTNSLRPQRRGFPNYRSTISSPATGTDDMDGKVRHPLTAS